MWEKKGGGGREKGREVWLHLLNSACREGVLPSKLQPS